MKKQMTRNYYLKNKSRNHHFTAVRSHSLREEHRLFSGAASFDILAKIFEIQIPKDNSLKIRLRLRQFTQVRFFFKSRTTYLRLLATHSFRLDNIASVTGYVCNTIPLQ